MVQKTYFKQACLLYSFLFTDSIEEVQKNCKDHKSQLELEKRELQEVCVCIYMFVYMYVCMYVHVYVVYKRKGEFKVN